MRRSQRILIDFATELLNARLEAGLSQEAAGAAAKLSADQVWRIEHNRAPSLSIADAAALGAVLGLDLSARFYPTGARIRDEAQAKRLAQFVSHIRAPLRYRTDAALPQTPDVPRDLRAWDTLIWDATGRTGVELEARLHDIQAMTRRHNLKRRDDPVDNFLLVVADTLHNRQVVREFAGLLPDLPRLRTSTVLEHLRAGRHPPTGFILFYGANSTKTPSSERSSNDPETEF